MTRTDILNAIIHKCGYTQYLEIGVQHGVNFQAIKCQYKVGVDPVPQYEVDSIQEGQTFKLTSDEFFKRAIGISDRFDLIFIDGLHHADQVLRDFNNAQKVLSPNGTIVLHDCHPPNEPCQRVPRETQEWCGDVWKAWVEIRKQNFKPGFVQNAMFCIDTDYGVGVYTQHTEVEIGKQALATEKEAFVSNFVRQLDFEELDYETLDFHRIELLNLISVEDWNQIINN